VENARFYQASSFPNFFSARFRKSHSARNDPFLPGAPYGRRQALRLLIHGGIIVKATVVPRATAYCFQPRIAHAAEETFVTRQKSTRAGGAANQSSVLQNKLYLGNLDAQDRDHAKDF